MGIKGSRGWWGGARHHTICHIIVLPLHPSLNSFAPLLGAYGHHQAVQTKKNEEMIKKHTQSAFFLRFIVHICKKITKIAVKMILGLHLTIETEKTPIEVRRIYPYPNWDGKCEFFKVEENGYGPSTCSAGEVLVSFEDETRIWDELFINGIHIGKVLENQSS